MEDLDPEFNQRVQPGDVVAAGDNFGCGSSREQAPLAIKAVGVAAVVGNYFARIFYRNAINIGLPVIEIGNHEIRQGNELEVDLRNGIVKDLFTGREYEATKMPQVMIDILNAGGLVNYLTEHGDYRRAPTGDER
jgi:3-isopropylmalate/(R)-2-methylmalate dehydratase small subunit